MLRNALRYSATSGEVCRMGGVAHRRFEETGIAGALLHPWPLFKRGSFLSVVG